MQLSKPQTVVLKHAKAKNTSLFAGGAVRSGKSWSIALSFGAWLLLQKERHDHAIVGQSIETIMRNMGFELMEMMEKLGGIIRLDKQIGTRLIVEDQSIWLIGANDAKARKRIQGSTLKGLVVEELTLLPEDFFWMAWSRLSVEDAKMWCSYNPEGPAHWAKRKVVDKSPSFKGNVLRFFMRDNPSLTEETIKRYEASFTGHFKKRLIEGEWAAAEGACFPVWHEPNPVQLLEGGRWSLALDWAASGTLAALAIHQKGKECVVRYELFHTGSTEGLLTESQAVDKVNLWWIHSLGLPNFGCSLWLDPATPAGAKSLFRKKGFRVKSADNSVVPGILTTANRLENKEILIHKDCENLKTELAGYVWDATAADRGEDKPTKKADHGCDALRYFAHSTGKAYRNLGKIRVMEAFNA